jgi:DNA-binding MarR family transcriptional regulator
VNRSEREGLLERVPDAADGRLVVLHMTRKGRQIMRGPGGDHALELSELAPRLARTLRQLGKDARTRLDAEAE